MKNDLEFELKSTCVRYEENRTNAPGTNGALTQATAAHQKRGAEGTKDGNETEEKRRNSTKGKTISHVELTLDVQ